MKKVLILSALVAILVIPTFAQSNGHLCKAYVVGQDTFPLVELPTCAVSAPPIFKNQRQYAAWSRLRYNVSVVYPYAIMVSAMLKEHELKMQGMNESQRKDYMKVVEEALKKEFKPHMEELSVTQGKILIKLINRETGYVSYELVKQLRGSFQAVLWQGFARICGTNLKDEYDAEGDDKMLEMAIKQVEYSRF